MDGENQPPAVVVPQIMGDGEVGENIAAVPHGPDRVCKDRSVEQEFVPPPVDGAEPDARFLGSTQGPRFGITRNRLLMLYLNQPVTFWRRIQGSQYCR
jgi:hypothetical protein